MTLKRINETLCVYEKIKSQIKIILHIIIIDIKEKNCVKYNEAI